MIRIGVIDDEEEQFNLIREKFDIYGGLNNIDFDLSYGIDYTKKEEVIDWILDEHLDCVIIDFRLLIKFEFSGVELINYIQDKLTNFPCVILTARKADVEDTKLVVKPLIYDKDEIITNSAESNEIQKFIENIQDYITVYKNQLSEKKKKYLELIKKYEEKKINDEEYNELTLLQRILVSYGIIEYFPLKDMGTDIENELVNILDTIKKIIE